ncbi:MAG: hypothetical protein ACFB20_05420 [Opitutales bacterium]
MDYVHLHLDQGLSGSESPLILGGNNNTNNFTFGGQLIVQQINNANGSLFVGTALVPEPSTYACVFGVEVFSIALVYRRLIRRY